MVTSATGAVIDLGGTTMLANANHERLIQEATFFQVTQQNRVGLIETRTELVLHAVEVVLVRIPRTIHRLVLIPKHGHEGTTSLDQPSRCQARVSKQVAAILLAHGLGLAANIDCVRHPRRCQHRVRNLLIAIKALRTGSAVEPCAFLVKLLEQRATGIESINGHPAGKLSGRGQRQAGIRRHPTVGVAVGLGDAAKRSRHLSRRFASGPLKVRPNWIVGRAQKPAVGPRP